jgi:hypothetical protein
VHRSRVVIALGAVLTALSLPASTGALEPTAGVEQTIERLSDVDAKHPNLDSALARLAEAKQGRRLIRVEAVARGGRRAEFEAAIRKAGGTTSSRYGNLIEARVPAQALERLAVHPAARRLRTPVRPHAQALVGQGIAATGAAAWHSAQTSGSGVEIAIVDLGFRDWQQRQLQGELPAEVATADFCPTGVFDGPTADDHGTAVAEIVHELAPAAKLHLVCMDDLISLGRAKDYVVANDIPLVNHSIAWFNTSRGDGSGGPETPDAVVADARAQGVLWISSAGNYGQGHWSGTFDPHPLEPELHEFSNGDVDNTVTLAGEACVFLRWDDWPSSDQDFDLYVFRHSNGELVGLSEGLQNGTQEPYEELCAENLGPPDEYDILIAGDGATEAPRFDLFVADGQGLEHSTPAGSVVEPASSPHALAVGAACWSDPLTVQPYSSRGPTIDGRTKPDVTGADAVSTVTYGAASGCESGFPGTSASAAHVAAAAALLKQANPGYGPAELQAALEAKTVDLPPFGKDNVSGAGRLALGIAPPIPPTAPANVVPPAISGAFNQGQTLTGSEGGWSSSPLVFAFRWLRCDASGGACVSILAARSRTYIPTAGDVGHSLRLRVTAANTGGSTKVLSAPTVSIQPPPQAPATVPATSAPSAPIPGSVATSGPAPIDTPGEPPASVAPPVSRDPDVRPEARLVVLGLSRTPHSPQAGRRYTLVLRFGTRAISGRAAAQRLICSAKLGRRSLPVTSKGLRRGTARCAWLLPRAAVGTRLKATIAVTAGRLALRRSVTAVVRGPRLR